MPLPALAVQSALLATILVDTLLIGVLFHKRRRSLIDMLLVVHLIGILGWAASILVLLVQESYLATQSSFAFALLLAASKYWFVLVFPENTFPKGRLPYLILPITLALALIAYIDDMLFTDMHVIGGYAVTLENGPLAGVYSLWITFLLIAPLVILWRKYRRESATSIRVQLHYLLIGYGIFFVLGLLTNSILPVFFDIYAFNGIGPSFSLILAGFVVYIITAHHFLDIRRVAQRSFVYTIVLAIAIGVYIAIAAAIGVIFGIAADITAFASAGITLVIGISGAPIVERAFRKWTDPIFFKDRYDLAEAIREITAILNSHIREEALIDELTRALKRILRVSDARIYLLPKARTEIAVPEEDLDAIGTAILRELPTNRRVFTLDELLTILAGAGEDGERIAHAARQRSSAGNPPEWIALTATEGHVLAALCVWEKESGEAFSGEDLMLLESISNSTAIALEKAVLYERVHAYSMELETRVIERTKEIAMLQEDQRRMMIDISHGLQTPLAIIKTGLARNTGADPCDLQDLEMSIDHASRYIYDLLALARLEHDSNESPFAAVDLAELVEELVEYASLPAEEAGIIFHTTIAHPVWINGREKQLSDALVNILGNAVKYMGDTQTKEIHITLLPLDGQAILRIKDTGPGIDPEFLPQLFKRFRRAESASKARGTGIGLAITKRIIELHGGTIRAESAPGEGTTFVITLPLAVIPTNTENGSSLPN